MQTETRFDETGLLASLLRCFGKGRTRLLSNFLGLLGALLVVVMAMPSAASAAECTTTWTGPAESTWQTAANWSTGKVPTSEDVACIGSGKTIKVTTGTQQAAVVQGEGALKISGGSLGLMGPEKGVSNISSVSMTGGALTGPGTLDITGTLTMENSSDLTGTGKTVIKPGATATFTPVGAMEFNERTFVNEGTATLPSSTLTALNGAVIENAGTFRNNSQSSGIGLGSGTAPKFINTGTFEKTSGTGTSATAIKFENKGVVKAETGNLSFNGGSSTSSSSFTAVEGKIIFGGSSFSIGSGTALSGDFEVSGSSTSVTAGGGFKADDLTINKGSLTVEGSALEVDDLVTIDNTAKVTLPSGTTSTVSTLAMGDGQIAGPGTLEINKSLTMENSSDQNGAGKTVIKPGATATFTPVGAMTFSERTVVNEGTATLPSSTLTVSNGAVIENIGTFHNNSQSSGIGLGSGTAPKFVNTGTFDKTSGTGTSATAIKFENKGVVKAETGNLSFNGGSSSSGSSFTAVESKIIFGGSSFSIGSGTALSGDFEVSGSSTSVTANGGFQEPAANLVIHKAAFNVEGGPLDVDTLTLTEITSGITIGVSEPASTVDTLNLNGGSINGSGTLNVASSFTAGASNLNGTGKLVIGKAATGTISAVGQLSISERTLLNEGTLTFSGGSIEMSKGSLIENRGTFKANSESGNPQIEISTGKEPRIANKGAFEKTAGTGKTVVAPNFENWGTVDSPSGELKILKPIAVPGGDLFGKRSNCGDPVECATGNLFESQTDFSIGGLGVGLMLTRTYSAQGAATAASPGIFGYGWSHSFGDRLLLGEGGATVTLARGDGSTVPFVKNGAEYTSPSWSQETLSGSTESGFVLTTADQATFNFSGTGRLESVVDRNGNQTTLSYDEEGRLEAIEDPAERTISLTYNGNGLVEGAEDPMGNLVEYAYEGDELVSVTQPGEEGTRWEFDYDASHRLTTMTDGRGGETTNEYDGSDRVILQTDQAGRTLVFDYESFNTKVTNEATGAITDQWFTSNNQPFKITYGFGTPDARTERFAYDDGGRLLSKTDPAGRKTTFIYNAAGDRTSMKDPAGGETKWTYNSTHDLLTRTSPGGGTTTIVRDENGNPESISRPAPGGATQTVTFDYDANGQLESTTDPLERTWSFEHSGQGDLIAETNPEGETRSWGYNENSYLTSEVSPRGNEEGAEPSEYARTIDRDPLGRPTEVIDPLGHTTEYKYDDNGNLESKTNPEGHTTTYFYNAVNELTKTEKPNGDTTETEYDGEGQVVSQMDGNEKTTTYDRNIIGQVVEVIDPLSRKKEIEYDLAGNIEKVIDPEEREVTYTYDPADRVIGIDYSSEGTADVTFEYDADGNVLEMIDGTGETSFEYDKLGRLIEAEDGHGDVVKYDYNLASEQDALTYPNGKTISRTFDDAGRLESVTDWLGGTTAFAYDVDSNLARITFPEATESVDEFSYDSAGFMDEVEFKQGGESSASIGYTRDKAAQIKAIITQGLPGSEEQEFTYDENGRLAETSAGTYEFDAADNLIKTPAASNSYNAASELEESGGTSYTYNLIGERTKATPESGPATSYSYDQAGGLVSIERPEEGEVAALDESFAYDGSRLATSHSVGESVRYLTWDTSRRMPRLLSDEDRSFIYGPGGLVVAHIDSEEVPTYYHHDQLGSTRMLSNSSGEATGAFSYEPYGSIEASSGSEGTPLGFAGQYTAADSGLQYLRARQFDSVTAQFMTKDPLAALTREPYAYGGGDPLLYTDPRGLGLCIASLIDCDEDDDPCASPLSWTPLCFIPVGSGAEDAVNNASAGAGDSALEVVPGVSPGPWLRDKLGINGVENCSAAYKFAKGLTDWASLTKGIASAGDWAGRHVPDVIKAGRGMARRQNERITHLPPEAEGMP